MLLLIRYRIVTQYCQFHIYIPLCFYLYSIHLNAGRGDDTFTFHYASTYTIKAAIKSGQIIEFTFHYASTYTKAPLQEYPDREIIYIPLCFYLYYVCILIYAFRICIYIPLCFYLYGILLWIWLQRDHIYIPLCFYLYRESAPCCVAASHLHSTMLLLIHALPIRPARSIRIYIPLCFYLYCTVSIWDDERKQIYIPLCFYLYPCIFLS